MGQTLALALVPVVLIAAVGAALARLTRLDFRAVHVVAYWVAGPALVFRTVFSTSLDARDVGVIGAYALVGYLALLVLTAGAGRVLGWRRDTTRGAALALASTNCANLGLPIVGAALGPEGLVVATAFVSLHIIVHVAVGGTYAGWDASRGIRPALRRALSIPYLYAVALALALRAVVPALPEPLDAALALVGPTWIPLLIFLLGVELAALPSPRDAAEALPLAVAKLLAPPALAFGLAALFGFEGMTRTVLILQASMPTAVNGVVFARQFGARPSLVAATLALSTAGCLITIPVLLSLLT